MLSYIVKRILLMIPTFVVISLIIFVILNLSPGDPGAEAAAEGAEAVSQEAQESYRIFQEQFNLDKPILVNTRFRLTKEDTQQQLETLAAFERPICPDEEALEELEEAEEEVEEGVPAPDVAEDDEDPTAADIPDPDMIDEDADPEKGECTPIAERPSSGEVIDTQERLTHWGDYVVPHLIDIAENHEHFDVRLMALNQLPQNARRPRVDRADRDPPDFVRQLNTEISRHNNEIRGWVVPPPKLMMIAEEEGEEAAEEQVSAMIQEMLDEHWKPYLDEHIDRFEYTTGEKVTYFFLDTRFARYWENLLPLTGVTDFQGRPFEVGLQHIDLGLSTVDQRPVLTTISEKLPYTITIAALAMLLAYLISVPIGIWSAYNQNTRRDVFMTVVLFILYSLPNFFVAVLLLEFFSVGRPFDWFPVGGFMGDAALGMPVLTQLKSIGWHIFLPVVCLTYPSLAALSRYARTGVLEVIRADYIRTARAKGLSEPMVIMKHTVRNGMIPILTVMGTALPFLVSGSLVIEYIFNIPGIGLYLYESIFMYDYNAIMGCLLMSAVLTLVGILLSDIGYALVDPRISFD